MCSWKHGIGGEMVMDFSRDFFEIAVDKDEAARRILFRVVRSVL